MAESKSVDLDAIKQNISRLHPNQWEISSEAVSDKPLQYVDLAMELNEALYVVNGLLPDAAMLVAEVERLRRNPNSPGARTGRRRDGIQMARQMSLLWSIHRNDWSKSNHSQRRGYDGSQRHN